MGPIIVCMEGITLLDALRQLETAKLAANRRGAYVKHLSFCVKTFTQFVGNVPISTIGTEHVESWLLSNGKNPSSRQTYIARLSTLFEFSKRRRWISENPCFFLERVTIDQNAPSVLSSLESDSLWRGCLRLRPSGSAWLALALYAGLRPEEAMMMQWEQIDFEGKRIFIRAETSKVRYHRIVEPPDRAFRALLEARAAGGQLPISNATKKRLQRKLRGIMGWKVWPKDILRHTCASHWLAVVPDAQKIALQLGNSPAILLRHYRSIVTKEDAERFWRG